VKRLLALMLIAAFGLSACGTGNTRGSAPELVVPIITQFRFDTATVTRGDIADVQQRTGIVRLESQPLNFGAVAASFNMLYVAPGDTVSYGQLLASLNIEHLERQIEQIEERIANMRQGFDFENELRRIDLQLARLNSATAPSSLELELAIERQNLQLSHAEADLQPLKARLAQSRLYAPFDGTIVYAIRRAHDSWVPSFAPIVYIAPEDARVFVEYTDTEPLILTLRAQVQAHIGTDIYRATRLSLTREQIARYISIPTRFVLESETGNSPPVGAFVSLKIYDQSAEDVLRLPRNAIFFDPGIGFYVQQMVNGELEMTTIAVGIRTETFYEIISGVQEGDEVYVRS